MKLLSLNVEGQRHCEKWQPFLTGYDPDIVCLMEAPDDCQAWLEELGYQVTFSPMCIRNTEATFTEGLLLATKLPHQAEIFYFNKYYEEIVPFDNNDKQRTAARSVIYARVGEINIATIHFTWTENGEVASEEQMSDFWVVSEFLKSKPPHFLCGDFNIPRFQNELYDELLKGYRDDVPLHYKSSLDKNLHRAGSNPELRKLFDSFMVDYLFTQPNLVSENVQLHFGLSDHAAITADILVK